MKKSTLLSLLTAGAVIATSAGTFAAWDNLSDDVEAGTITFERINVAASATQTLTLQDDGNALHADESQSAVAKINVDLSTVPSNLITDNKVKLVFNPSVKDTSNQVVDSSKYTIEIKDTDGTTTLTDATDTTLVSSNTNEYTITVTPTDTTLAGQQLKVDVTATLTEVTPAS